MFYSVCNVRAIDCVISVVTLEKSDNAEEFEQEVCAINKQLILSNGKRKPLLPPLFFSKKKGMLKKNEFRSFFSFPKLSFIFHNYIILDMKCSDSRYHIKTFYSQSRTPQEEL